MKKFFLFFLISLCAFALFAEDEFQVFNPREQAKTKVDERPASPLQVNGSNTPEINLGKVLKLSHRFFPVVVQNPSDEEIKYSSVVVNCSCTSIVNQKEVPVPGVIPPHGELKLFMGLNANEMDTTEFIRMIRFDIEGGYRPFQINFSGSLDTSIYMTYGDDPEQIKRGNVNVGYIPEPSIPWNTDLYITSDPSNPEPLELDTPHCSSSFVAGLHRFNDHRWMIELHGVTPMKIGEFRDEGVVVPVKSPAVPEGQRQIIVLPVIGICGTQIVPTAGEIYMSPTYEGETYTKDIRLERQPFMDKNAVIAMVKGKPNPYAPVIKVLTVEEVILPTDVPGVEFSMEQRPYGVLLHCKMTMKDLVVGGALATFQVKDAKPAEVWFGILSEERRRQMEEEDAQKAQEAALETEALKQQEELQKR